MTTTEKIVLKSLLELEPEINSGAPVHAAGLNHAEARVGLLAPGRYFAELDINPGGDSLYLSTEEGRVESLAEFIGSIQWDETVAHDLEFKTYMSQSIWYAADEIEAWNLDSFVWPENHVESMEVIQLAAEQAKANRRAFEDAVYTTTTEFRELQIMHDQKLAELKGLIKKMATEFVGKYPTWEYADHLARDLAAIDWEQEFQASNDPFLSDFPLV